MEISSEFLDELFNDERFKDRLVNFIQNNMELDVRTDNGGSFEQRSNQVRVSVKLKYREERTFGYGDERTVLEASDSVTVDAS